MRLSNEVEIALQVAAAEAGSRRHEMMSLEHLLFALLMDSPTADVLRHAGGDVAKLKIELEKILAESSLTLPAGVEQAPQPTLAVQRVIRRAVAHVQGAGKDEVKGSDVLIAMFAESDSRAAVLLELVGVTRLDVVSYISHGVSKLRSEEDDETLEPGQKKEGGASSDPLGEFTTNLNLQAKERKIDPLVGREREVERVIQILARRTKNNPILVGDSGVGKTAIAEGLAQKIVEGKVPRALLDAVVYSLDMASLIAGTRFRGDFEERMKGVMKAIQKIPNAILFIDEIHNLVGLGSTSGQSSVNAANMLKPALSSGRLRCMGSTTFDEYRQNFEKDRALARRFQKVDVGEPSVEDTEKILDGLRGKYEEFHGVTYGDGTMRAAAELSFKYLHDRKLPDKAIDLMDEAGANVKLRLAEGEKGVVTVADIEFVLSRIAQIPPKEVSGSDRDRLRTLEQDLRGVVFGQDRALAEVATAMKLSRAGLRSPEKPIGNFLFTGPTGVGKTEVAKQLAKTLGIAFLRFDMSEYMERHTVSRLIGAPPGYVGFDQGGLLTDAVVKTPNAVLLLDEIEKAHPDIFNILLQVMDHGKLTDNNGKSSDFRHVILIMTSNVGARDLLRRTVGFEGGRADADADREYKKMFSPEFRNRLDARVAFESLTPAVMLHVVDKFLKELDGQVSERDVELTISVAAREHLAKKGYDPDLGARPLARVIQEDIKKPLSEELLFGKLADGGTALIDLEGDKLTFEYTPTPPEKVASNKKAALLGEARSSDSGEEGRKKSERPSARPKKKDVN